MSNGHFEVVSRRDGSSGTSYARREVDCKSNSTRYLGEGDTYAQALETSSTLDPMSRAVEGSISSEIAIQACLRVPRKYLQ
jgi:hypothetical protein